MGYMAACAAFVTHQSQECMGVLTDTTTITLLNKILNSTNMKKKQLR